MPTWDAYCARWNLLLHAILGLLPLVGDLLDVAHRANRRNYRLLEAAMAASPDPLSGTKGVPTRSDRRRDMVRGLP